MPTNQEQRNLIARMKLIPVQALIDQKKLLLIDDSIVRGTQLRETTEFLYQSGAKEVHVRPACPPLLYGCKFLNFSRSKSELDLITRRIILEKEGENAEKTAEKGYYESLVQSKSCQWNKPLAYPNLKDESQFDANDYTNWASAVVESAMVKDGYSVFFQDLNLCKGEKFYGLGAHEMRSSGHQVTAGYQGRIYIMMTVAGGAFDLSVEDGEGTVLWEQENVTESNQIFLDIDEMPESVIGVLTDHTKEEDLSLIHI